MRCLRILAFFKGHQGGEEDFGQYWPKYRKQKREGDNGRSKKNDPRQFLHLTVEEFSGVTELKDQH
jgi:hypothetical protein